MVDTPIITTTKSPEANAGESEDVAAEVSENIPSATDREKARQLFNDPDEVVENEPAAWLGDIDRAMVRKAYMELFNWTNMDILAALRSLCTKMALKGETQQVDRVLDALSTRWCECNPNHGFKAVGMCNSF
jgi:Sec7-like guanine-nucleotide exchange factor